MRVAASLTGLTMLGSLAAVTTGSASTAGTAAPAVAASGDFSQFDPPPLCSAAPSSACIHQPSSSWQGAFAEPILVDMPTMVVNRSSRGGDVTGRVTFSIIDAGTAQNGDASRILGFKNPTLLLTPIDGYSDLAAGDVYLSPDPEDSSHCQGDKLACTYVTTSTNLLPGWYRATDLNGLMVGARACPASSPNGTAGCYETYSESAVYIPKITDVSPPEVRISTAGRGLTTKAVAVGRDPYGKGLSLTWDFGDGTQQTGSFGKVVTHTYAEPADYTVTAKVATTDGRYSSDSAEAGILPPRPVLQAVGRIGAGTTGAAAASLPGWPASATAIVWSFTDGCPPTTMTNAQQEGGIFSSGYIPLGDDDTVGLGLNYLPTDADAFVVEASATLSFDGRSAQAHRFSDCLTTTTALFQTSGDTSAGATEIPVTSSSVPVGHVVALDVASSTGGNPDLSEQRAVTGHGSLLVDALDLAHPAGAYLLDAGVPLDPYVVPGPPAAPGPPALPDSAPSPPTSVSVTVLPRHRVRVSFKTGATGGDKIIGFRAECRPAKGRVRAASATRSPLTVGGLTKGTRYTCVVRAKNDYGFGGPSRASKRFTAS